MLPAELVLPDMTSSASAASLAEHRDRLPTLLEVLSRQTLSPVDLFAFYIFMRDHQHSVDYLDFWLDITQHMSLCRHYVRELRRSVLLETPEPENAFANGSSESIDHNTAGPSGYNNGDTGLEDTPQRLSAFLRSEGRTSIHSAGSSQSDHSAHNGPDIIAATHFGARLPDPNSPGHTVTREDIRASAVRILYTYLLPGSEREVQLPELMRNEIICMIEDEGRDDPEVFDDPKDFVFQAMEREAFPRFLQAKVFGNLVQQSITIRLVLAGASLLGAFWAAWYGILSDQPRNVRCWIILPFAIGCYFLSSYQYKTDPVLAFIGLSEYNPMKFTGIREPYVRKMINRRATMSVMVASIVAAALCIIFILVPGRRL